MSPSEITRILSSLGTRPNKRLGQHFLIDEYVLDTIVETADIHAGDHVLEIGPGLGVLTRALVARGAFVTAIEQDRLFVEYLNKTSMVTSKQAHIVHGDAARLDWQTIVGDDAWKLVSNLPYSITSLALRKALCTDCPPKTVTVLVQREVAERVVSVAANVKGRSRGKTSLLSLMVALSSSSAEIVKLVPAGAFYPMPKVESVILSIKPLTIAERRAKWGIDPETVMALGKRGFSHPRKLLASNLAPMIVKDAFESISIPAKARAEDLSSEQWVELTRWQSVVPEQDICATV